MNPMNRRMFRDPRAARRATGILASSAPLMTAAQMAMAQGQPMRAQTGASVNLNDLYPDDSRYKRMPIIGGPSVSVSEARRPPAVDRGPFGYLEQYRAMSMDPSLAGPTDNPFLRIGNFIPQNILTDAFKRSSVKSPARLAADAELARQEEVQRTSYTSRFDPPDLVAAAAMPAASSIPTSGPVMPMSERFRATDEDVPYGRMAEDDPSRSISQAGLTETERTLLRRKNQKPATVEDGTIPSDVAKGEGENLAQGTTSAAVAAVDDALSNREKTQKVITPETAVDAAADIAKAKEDAKKKRSAGRGVSETQNQAAQNDKNLGIDPELSRKERVEQRYNLLKDLIGEDKAKDVRTDKNYNLMMLGLRIAAGQSEDALQNIAVGAGQQLEAFGEVKGEETQRAAERDLSIKLQAANEVGEEIAAEEERKYQLNRDENDQAFQRAMQDDRLGSSEGIAAVQLQWNEASKVLDRDLSRELSESSETLQLNLQKIRSIDSAADREAAYKRLMSTHKFQANQAAEGRIFDLEKLIATQDFAREKGMNDQAFQFNLAAFTNSLPTETQKFYTNFLSEEQIVDVLMAKVNDSNLDVDVSKFVSEAMKDERRREDGRNEIARQSVIKANPALQKDDPDEFQRQLDALIPEINDQQLTTYFTNGYNSVFKRTKTTE